MVNCCGLLTRKNEPVPLKQVEVAVQVQGHVASVSSTLHYENKEQNPLEAIFVFPLEGGAALWHFSAKIGETEVVAELLEKEKAKEQYDDAVSSGQEAFLLEESEESADVFQLSVGSLPPGEKASVTLSYVIELAVQADEALRFCLPAVLNPRYAPQDSGSVPQVTAAIDGSVPYTLSLSVHLSSPSPITKVESNCPLQPLKYLNTEKTQATVSLSPGHMFDRDVELLMYYSGAHQPTAIVEVVQSNTKPGSLMGDPVVMLSLYPEFPTAVTSSLATCGEFLFLVDRSGSMQMKMHGGQEAQTRIKSARDTLLLLLKSLPIGCFFNIYGFGSSHDSFFPKSVEYSQETMEQALKKVGAMQADLGGTAILSPLEHIYSQPCLPEHPRQLFVFTDGEVWDTKDVLALVKRNALSHRCFSFGIGEGASTALIKGMAMEGSGHAQFITGTERLQPKVMQSLRFALQPAVKDISVKWNVPEGVSVTPLSPPINMLFQGQRCLLYAQLTGQSAEAAEGSVSVQYRLGEQSVEDQVKFSVKPGENTGLTIHRLGAQTLIRTLETHLRTAEQEGQREDEAECLRKRVIELSVQSGVSSVLTAFIAVHAGSALPVQLSLVRRHVPTPLSGGGMPRPGTRQLSKVKKFYKGKSCRPRQGARMCSLSPVNLLMGQPRNLSVHIVQEPVAMRRGRATPLPTAGATPPSLMCDTAVPEPPQPQQDILLQLISLQKASGSWDLVAELAQVFGKTEEEVAKQKPPQVDSGMWATVLAVLWLYGFRKEEVDEWQFVAMKAVSWIRAQTGGSASLCVQAGNALLGCQVQEGTLGL